MQRLNTRPFPARTFRLRMMITCRCCYSGVTWSGSTLRLSSGRITVALDGPVYARELVQIVVDWPAKMEGTCLGLWLNGEVVKARGRVAVIRIRNRYEFHTRARHTLKEVA